MIHPAINRPLLYDPALYSALAAIGALAVAVLALKNTTRRQKIEREVYIQQLIMEFIKIQASGGPAINNKQSLKNHNTVLCNYIETVCYFLEEKKVTEKEVKLIIDTMKDSTLINVAKSHGPSKYQHYIKWLKRKKLINKHTKTYAS